jgi:hypothetical protein
MPRKPLSKMIRFEVFKRDSFTCQYCGRKAPDVLLDCDHIKPVAKGGTNDLLNLTTSCQDCNSGKSDRELSDSSVIDKQRAQLEALQERKEQIELMFEWQKGLLNLDDHVADQIAEYWAEQAQGYSLNERGLQSLKKLRNTFDIAEILSAIKLATERYLEWEDGKPTASSVEEAWSKVGGICKISRLDKENPELKRLYYIRGILRNRFSYVNDKVAMPLLKECIALNASMDSLEEFSKTARNWTQWRDGLEDYIESARQKSKEGESGRSGD